MKLIPLVVEESSKGFEARVVLFSVVYRLSGVRVPIAYHVFLCRVGRLNYWFHSVTHWVPF